MRAPITRLSAPDARPRTREVMIGLGLTLALIGLIYAGASWQDTWRLRVNEQAWTDYRAGEQRHVASRYGDVRLPVRGEMCTSFAFDNWFGGYVSERETLCEPPRAPRQTPVPFEKSSDPDSRMQGIAAGFRR